MGSTHLGRWVEGGLELYEKNQFEQAKERKPVSRVPLSTLLQAYAEYTGMRLLESLDPVLSSFTGNKWVECRCGVHLPVKMTRQEASEGEQKGLPEQRFLLLCAS